MFRSLPRGGGAGISRRVWGNGEGYSKLIISRPKKDLGGHLSVFSIFPDVEDHLGDLVSYLNFWAVFQIHILSKERTRRCRHSSHLSDLVLRGV